jgi:aminoglycoside N3'-acetyltransferase
MLERLLAGLEVGGRHAAELVPGLRSYANKWVRKTPREPEAFTLAEFRQAIVESGVEPGRDLLVHASWSGFQRLQARPSELLTALREIVGPEHTLVMPTGAVEKLQDGILVYDVARSPSRMGMLSETLRRTKGSLRSPVPIAPVSAIGPGAEAYCRDYREEASCTPWGKGSPFWEIAHRGGQVLVLGIDFVRTLTIMHTAFDLLLDENPIPNYYEPVEYLVIRDGQAERWALRQQQRYLERHLATYAFRRLALASGTLRERSWKGVRICVVDARAFLDWHLPLAKRTGLPYWGWSLRGKSARSHHSSHSAGSQQGGAPDV